MRRVATLTSMKRLVALGFLATLLSCAAVLSQPSASAEPGASRIVDRTLLCTTRSSGGIYEIEATGYSGVRESRSKWAKLPFAVVSTGNVASAATVLENSLAWITAGNPHSTTLLGDYNFPVRAVLYGTLAVNRSVCRSVSTRIPLTASGLGGGAAGQLGEVLDCASPRRVVVRVRAVLESPGTLKGHDIFVLTTAPVRAARIAVRTQAGKPLAFASVQSSGKTTLFTAKGCVPE